MSNPQPDSFTIATGGAVLAGINGTLPAIASAGVVTALAKNITSSGFNLLTTETNDDSIYRHSGHAGCVWDEANQFMWIFGAETHNSVNGMDNAVYRFNVENGKFELIQPSNTWPGEYRMDAGGILWADAAHTRPWAMHSFNRMYYDPVSKIISVLYDPWEHAYWTTPIFEDPAMSGDDRTKCIWHFNTVTAEWTYTSGAGITSLSNALDLAKGATFVPGYGWYVIGGTYLRKVDLNGVYSSVNLLAVGAVNSLDHTKLMYHDGYLYCMMGVSTSSTQFLSIHNIDDPTGDSVEFQRTDFTALDGWYTSNKCACLMSDGNILFIAHNSTALPNVAGAFIFNTTTRTVTDTGHRIVCETISYDWKLVWSDKYDCAIWLAASVTSPEQVYMIKV